MKRQPAEKQAEINLEPQLQAKTIQHTPARFYYKHIGFCFTSGIMEEEEGLEQELVAFNPDQLLRIHG